MEYLETLGEEHLWQAYEQALDYCNNESQLGFSNEHKEILLRLRFRSFEEKFKIVQKYLASGADINTQQNPEEEDIQPQVDEFEKSQRDELK